MASQDAASSWLTITRDNADTGLATRTRIGILVTQIGQRLPPNGPIVRSTLDEQPGSRFRDGFHRVWIQSKSRCSFTLRQKTHARVMRCPTFPLCSMTGSCAASEAPAAVPDGAEMEQKGSKAVRAVGTCSNCGARMERADSDVSATSRRNPNDVLAMPRNEPAKKPRFQALLVPIGLAPSFYRKTTP